jgi:hypothetical protein
MNRHAPDGAQNRHDEPKSDHHHKCQRWGPARYQCAGEGFHEVRGHAASPRKSAPKGQQNAKNTAPAASTAMTLARRRVHPKIALRKATLAVNLCGTCSRIRVDTAQVTVLASGRRSIHWRFAGSKGSITIELPRKEAWELIEKVQEQSIAPVQARPKIGPP